MGATTVMGVIMIVWCLVTLAIHPEKAKLPTAIPDLSVKQKVVDQDADRRDPRRPGPPARPARLHRPDRAGRDAARAEPGNFNWLSLIGVMGIMVAFGHSILAMSGEETLAQVYREVESPKLPNFKKAAFIVFIYSMLLTSLISFFAVMIIPDDVRIAKYGGNLIGGLAMNVVGPHWAQAGAERAGRGRRLPDPLRRGEHGDRRLQRRAEPGGRGRRPARLVPQAAPEVRDDLSAAQPGRRRCRSSRSSSAGATSSLLGEAYAFGVVWSFVFNAAVDAGPAVQAAGAPRVRGPAQRPGRQVRVPHRDRADLPRPGHRPPC